MKKIKLMDYIANADLSNEKIIIGTITEIKSKNNNHQKLLGEKFLLVDSENDSDENQDKLFYTDKISSLSKKIRKKINDKNIIDLRQPKMYNIEIEIEERSIEVEIFFEAVQEKPRLILFGSGHVSQPLAKIAKIVGFSVVVVDDREDLLSEKNFPTADKLVCNNYIDYIDELKIHPDDYLVIITRGHKHDYDVLKNIINSNARYIGMIGSNKKVQLTFDRLKEKDNIKEERLEEIDAPIGLDIGSETPAEIGISIMSKIISVRRDS